MILLFQMSADSMSAGLDAAFLFSPICDKDLTAVGTNGGAIQKAASNAIFSDGIGSSATIASTYPGAADPAIAQNAPPGTIGGDIAAHPLSIVAEAD